MRYFSILFIFMAFLVVSCSKESDEKEITIHPQPNPPVVGEDKVLPYPLDSSFAVVSLPSAESERVRLDQQFKAADFIPTGWFAQEGKDIVVNLKRTAGLNYPTLIIGTYNQHGLGDSYVQNVYLTPGNNTIKVQKSGLIYIRYEGVEGQHKATVKFLSGIVPAAFYVAGKTTKEQWRGMLNTYTGSTEAVLFGGKVIIVVNRRLALDNVSQDQELLLKNANAIWNYEDEISGLDNSSEIHKPNVHNHLMTESSNNEYYMAAYQYGTFYNNTTAIQVLVKPDEMNTWGPWHELGHHHQQRSYLWNNMTEVSVNIYSLYVEKKAGANNRFKDEGTWKKIKSYLNQSPSLKNYDKTDLDLFVKLGLFMQLYLAYGDDFFIKLHRDTREQIPNTATDLSKKRYFMLKACEISGHDLTQFFKDWGMVGVESVYSEINALHLPLPSVNPSTLGE